MKLIYDIRHQVEPDDAPEYTVSGTGDEWRQNIGELCVCNSRLLLSVSLAFAAPLLDLLKIEAGGVHLFDDSSTGKSTCQHVAASVYGFPGPPGIVNSWNATYAASEGMAKLRNHGAYILDELGQGTAEGAGRLAYSLTSGEGKRRANQRGELQESHHYQVLILSSGECPFSDFLRRGGVSPAAGQEIRMADVPADAGQGCGAFDNTFSSPTPAHFADRLKDATKRYHGAVFREYMQRVVDDLHSDHTAFLERVKGHMGEFFSTAVGTLPPGSGQVNRVANRFALISAAGELATGYRVTGWSRGDSLWGAHRCFSDWCSRRDTTGNLEVYNLVQQVKAFFDVHGESRFTTLEPSGEHRKAQPRTINRAGWKKHTVDTSGTTTTTYYLSAIGFREMVQGYDPRRAANLLIAQGYISPGKDGQPTMVMKTDEGTKRVYHFPPREEPTDEDAEQA